jgi:hypothetical protein
MSNHGIPPMTQQSTYSGSPQNAAIQAQNAKNVSQANANKMSGGKKYRKSRKSLYRKSRKSRKSKKRGGSSIGMEFLLSWNTAPRKKIRKTHKTHKKTLRGGAVSVPQAQMLYTPTNGTGSNPNDQMKAGAQIQSQGTENAKYDNKLNSSGGGRRLRKAGSNHKWGCYSGGKK